MLNDDMMSFLAAVLGTRGGTPPTGITIGTTGQLTFNGGSSGSYTFSPGPPVDGGGKALLVIVVWVTAFGTRNSNHAGDPDTFTLNGFSPDAILCQYLQNTGSNKYVQAVAGLWNSPSAGDLVVDFYGVSATGCGVYFMNLGGLAASPLGTLVREQFSTGTALPFQLTTTAANSLVVSINGTRNPGRGPFTFDDASFVSLGEYTESGLYDGTWNVGYRNNLAVGTYDCGGDWTNSDSQRIGGGAFELKAA